jgi:hypothetical protein
MKYGRRRRLGEILPAASLARVLVMLEQFTRAA